MTISPNKARNPDGFAAGSLGVQVSYFPDTRDLRA